MKHYFVIGFEHCEMVTEKEMQERINDEYYGDPEEAFFTTWPKEKDPNYWGQKSVIIEGEFRTVQPIEVVKKWKMSK